MKRFLVIHSVLLFTCLYCNAFVFGYNYFEKSTYSETNKLKDVCLHSIDISIVIHTATPSNNTQQPNNSISSKQLSDLLLSNYIATTHFFTRSYIVNTDKDVYRKICQRKTSSLFPSHYFL